jgi:putative PIN family toxin of toxin-antitoxin system
LPGRAARGKPRAGADDTMRIVLDTNVVVAGLLTDHGAPAQVVDLCLSGDLTLVVDGRILREYHEVLHRRELALPPRDIADFLGLMDYAERAIGVPLPLEFPDQGDLPFIEVAVAAAVDAIVTGNVKHFHSREGRLDLDILTPRQLLNRISR